MKNGKHLLIGLLVLIPTVANAGILDVFGVGTVVKSITDVTWKVYLIKTVASMGPLILMLSSIIGIIVIAWAVIKLGDAYAETVRSVLRDEKVSRSERWIVGIQSLYTLPAMAGLVFVGIVLGVILYKGTKEIISYVPPPAVEAQVAKGK